MMKHFFIHLTIYVLLATPASLQAQELFAQQYNITYITMNNGLQHNYIDDIYKDSRGFLWVSTAGGGLSRYDGYEFVHYHTNTTRCKLKSNFTRNVCEDSFGRLWVTSEGGTDVIDLATLQTVVPRDSKKILPHLLNQPSVRVMKDSKGCLWLFYSNTLCRIQFDDKGEVATLSTLSPVVTHGPDIAMNDIDQDGNIWIGTNNNVCKVSSAANGELQTTPIASSLYFENTTYISTLCAKENEVWMATDRGLYRYNKSRNIVKHYVSEPANARSLSQNYLTGLAVTNDKQLLISTLKGASVYNPITDDFERISCDELPTGDLLNSNFVNCIFIDGDQLWFGTETGGINKFTPRRLSIHNYTYNKKEPYSLSHHPVNAIYEDSRGSLWVGTVEGGLNKKERGSNRFIHYTKEQRGGLSHNSVSALTCDNQNRLWVGTWGGGINLLSIDAPHRILRQLSMENTNGFPINFVGTLIYDPINKGVWIGANQGLYFYDLAADRIISPFANGAAANVHGCIGSIIDKHHQLWIGCLEGVYIVDLHARTTQGSKDEFAYRHLSYQLNDPTSQVMEKITCFCQTADGTLWLGSNGYGVYKRSIDGQGKEKFISFTTNQGLPNNSIRSILEGTNGQLWIGTNNGLSCYTPSDNHFTNYTKEDGLLDTQFYWNASYQSDQGRLYFGSVAGLMVIESDRQAMIGTPTRVRLTRLRIGNEEIHPDGEHITEDISMARVLMLHASDKSFSLEFSSLNSDPRAMATYSYRLIGFDDDWIQVPASRRFANYTNLRSGAYTFQVKYTAGAETKEEMITELPIVITPYFYKTTWFLLLIILSLSLLAWQFYQWRIRLLKRQKELLHRTVQKRTHELELQTSLLEEQTTELSRQNKMLVQQNEKITRQKGQLIRMSRKVQELTLDKLSFFTNITHEFRTPITLIIGPIERALKLSYNPQVIEQLHFVERNSKYLLSLVNQLMDFRKVESGKLEIVKTSGNFLNFIDSLIVPFDVFAKDRAITIKRCYRVPAPYILYDEEAMRKVVTNLLSNAIKFTPNGGEVTLYIASLPALDGDKERLYICVSDSGVGIAMEDLSKIFNRFYQSHHQVKFPVYGQAGTGIGLYLCKRIVQMHAGQITATNNRGGGCSFRIFMPLHRQVCKEDNGIIINQNLYAAPATQPQLAISSSAAAKLTILVVEDNRDMRKYIRSILLDHYQVIEAADGADALSLLNTHTVDFIISDLMMPVMDGIELSKRVKETFSISHIPFLMLTAKTSNESRLESYRMGVDEYLLKPFDENLLLARIDNILANRKRYQHRFALDMDVEVLHMEDESSDKKFLGQVMEVIKVHYKNSYFEVSDFSEAMGVSKSLLNKKLQSFTGQSAGQFIRNYRLNIARELIIKNRETRSMNVSEIAYEVGFNDPKYFTRCFAKHFNSTPSGLMEGMDG